MKGMSPIGFEEMVRKSHDSPWSFVACYVALLQVHWLHPGCKVETERERWTSLRLSKQVPWCYKSLNPFSQPDVIRKKWNSTLR